jgi:hypothetical protein
MTCRVSEHFTSENRLLDLLPLVTVYFRKEAFQPVASRHSKFQKKCFATCPVPTPLTSGERLLHLSRPVTVNFIKEASQEKPSEKVLLNLSCHSLLHARGFSPCHVSSPFTSEGASQPVTSRLSKLKKKCISTCTVDQSSLVTVKFRTEISRRVESHHGLLPERGFSDIAASTKISWIVIMNYVPFLTFRGSLT